MISGWYEERVLSSLRMCLVTKQAVKFKIYPKSLEGLFTLLHK